MVASIVLGSYGLGEQHSHFQCDNCCGQNKNNIVIWYLLWRVLVGLHRIITLSFMLIRHTKFTPDWHFGIWKSKWREFSDSTVVRITLRKVSKVNVNVSCDNLP
ncbi:hypothetical protein DPMN_134645 [Dreissena polymorpha]|uniref:DUF7869 domain-containing protein n=1 Tax=Dreissena polymorpha TaxID=45954 RepID=A0A9D4FXQ0_DREPO|nr:hypothetical protein DPMN_134645 [Dreissena polymorpha]